MKKKLEAELISIAHRILKMKNKSDLAQLHQETQKLYEKLSVLRFVEENFSDTKPTIGHAEIEEHLAVIFDNQIPTDTTANAPAIAHESEISEPVNQNKDEAIGEIISGITEKASQHDPETEAQAPIGEDSNESQNDAAEPVAEPQNVEPVAALESPEEEVAPIEAEATEDAQDAPKQPEDKPEPAPEPEPAEIEEPNEEEKPKEHVSDKLEDDLFKPSFEWSFEAKGDDSKENPATDAKITPSQISFDDLLGQDYVDPVFVKPEDVDTPSPAANQSENDRRAAELAESNRRLADLREAAETRQNVIPISRNFSDTSNVISINKENLNDRVSKGITIGLNDRIAFMKHLFDNSSEDYNRVLSQLITFDTLAEAKDFIDNVVKPDYNNWDGKDEYEQRFMEIVEKKFS